LNNYTAFSQIHSDLKSGKTTVLGLVRDYIYKIDQNKHLNAFLEVYADEALHQAKKIDKKLADGTAGKLAGMVIGLKDVICHKNHKVSASSKFIENFTSLYSATVTERLLAEDAIIIGRTNCDEFAMGSSNENSAFGPVLNPHDNKRVPGGSSGGSTAAVAAGLCLAALGSDTGGSIRQPSSFCGVIGIKPTYGRVSRYGLLAYASSFDQIGPITNTVEDAALILEIIAGKDAYDATASSKEVPHYSKELNFNGKSKIGYITECIDNPHLDKEIATSIKNLIDKLKSEGHTVEPVSFPFLDYMVPTYYVLTTAEASSNLSRYGGVIYGRRSPNATDINSIYSKSRTEGFGEEVKRRIMLGTFVLSSGYYDAYYTKAQKVRRILQDKTLEILKTYDFILLPTTPKTAFELDSVSDPVTMYLEDIFTVQANLTGMPAISLPMGNHSNGMPFGIQLIGRKFEEANLLAFSNYLYPNK
jgi:aspartyl-tRNA(Asn)/glutamyl-tRNA(Gln) amidotransferase subunit A